MKRIRKFAKALADDDELVIVRKSDLFDAVTHVGILADAPVETLTKAQAQRLKIQGSFEGKTPTYSRTGKPTGAPKKRFRPSLRPAWQRRFSSRLRQVGRRVREAAASGDSYGNEF